MPFQASKFDAIMNNTSNISIFDMFGVDVYHTDRFGGKKQARVIPTMSVVDVGQFDDRVTHVESVEALRSDDPAIGDTWEAEDGSTWKADAIISDDGNTIKFIVVEVL